LSAVEREFFVKLERELAGPTAVKTARRSGRSLLRSSLVVSGLALFGCGSAIVWHHLDPRAAFIYSRALAPEGAMAASGPALEEIAALKARLTDAESDKQKLTAALVGLQQQLLARQQEVRALQQAQHEAWYSDPAKLVVPRRSR